jgi:hypothetical protein
MATHVQRLAKAWGVLCLRLPYSSHSGNPVRTDEEEKNGSSESEKGWMVTNLWLEQNGPGLTAAQFAILGVSWPPKRGWKRRVIGKILSMEKRNEFEARTALRKLNSRYKPFWG